MPIPFAPLVGFLLGVAFAWSAATELGRDDGPLVASRPFAVTLAFAGLVYVPVVGYFAAFHGDWSYVYVLAWRNVPSALDFALVLVGAGAVLLGFVAAVPLVRKRRQGAVVMMAVVPAAMALALLALTARRLTYSATYAQFHGDFGTEHISASALGRGVLFMGLMLALGAGWCVRALWGMAVSRR